MIHNRLAEGFTIYPPLSALPEIEQSSGFPGTSYALLTFLGLHLIILVIAARKLFKKAP